VRAARVGRRAAALPPTMAAAVDVSDGGLPRIGSLDLSEVKKLRDGNAVNGGEQQLNLGDIPMSPRASSEQMLLTPRTAMGKKDTKRAQFVSAQDLHGEGAVAIASNGEIHASIGINGKLALWDAAGSKLLCQVTLQLPAELEKKEAKKKADELASKPPSWMAFDCEGKSLGIHRPGVGLWLCQVRMGEQSRTAEVTNALMLGDGKMSAKFTWVGFSSVEPGLLAVGVDGGRVMLFNPETNKLTSQKDGKHPGKHVAIVAGDWLKDGRLAVASGERMKVSAPITHSNIEWQTFAKFYINGMTSKIPTHQVSTTKTYDATPRCLAVSLATPPYIAMSLGDKVVTIMDYSGAYKEEGFFIPLDYGHIVGMVWVDHEVLMIALANGYVVLVSAPLLMRQRKNAAATAAGRPADDENSPPVTTKAMSTTRIFQNYCSAALELEGSPAVIGDKSMKVLRIDMAKWGTEDFLTIAADIEIEGYDGRVGTSLQGVACRPIHKKEKLHVAVTSTGGLLHGFSLPGSGAAVYGT